jgi:cell shape-determining protein MreC
VFDLSWQGAVRIGATEANGLLKGGTEMMIDLIAENDVVVAQDVIVSASSDLPYGLVVGKVREIRVVAGEPFKRAIVEPVIRLQDLRNVTIRHQ